MYQSTSLVYALQSNFYLQGAQVCNGIPPWGPLLRNFLRSYIGRKGITPAAAAPVAVQAPPTLAPVHEAPPMIEPEADAGKRELGDTPGTWVYIDMCSTCNYPTNYSYKLTNAPAARLAV